METDKVNGSQEKVEALSIYEELEEKTVDGDVSFRRAEQAGYQTVMPWENIHHTASVETHVGFLRLESIPEHIKLERLEMALERGHSMDDYCWLVNGAPGGGVAIRHYPLRQKVFRRVHNRYVDTNVPVMVTSITYPFFRMGLNDQADDEYKIGIATRRIVGMSPVFHPEHPYWTDMSDAPPEGYQLNQIKKALKGFG